MGMAEPAVQDQYPDDHAHCFGCGRLNPHGLQLKSRWDGDEAVCRFTPDSKYTGGYPGYLYGGMIASLIDCHAAATAAAARARADNSPIARFVTASLQVDYLAPTPIGTELELRGRSVAIKDRKVTVEVTVTATGKLCARGRVVMVRIKDRN